MLTICAALFLPALTFASGGMPVRVHRAIRTERGLQSCVGLCVQCNDQGPFHDIYELKRLRESSNLCVQRLESVAYLRSNVLEPFMITCDDAPLFNNFLLPSLKMYESLPESALGALPDCVDELPPAMPFRPSSALTPPIRRVAPHTEQNTPVEPKPNAARPQQNDNLIVRTPAGHMLKFHVQNTDTVADVKNQIKNKYGVDPVLQRLTLRGHTLDANLPVLQQLHEPGSVLVLGFGAPEVKPVVPAQSDNKPKEVAPVEEKPTLWTRFLVKVERFRLRFTDGEQEDGDDQSKSDSQAKDSKSKSDNDNESANEAATTADKPAAAAAKPVVPPQTPNKPKGEEKSAVSQASKSGPASSAGVAKTTAQKQDSKKATPEKNASKDKGKAKENKAKGKKKSKAARVLVPLLTVSAVVIVVGVAVATCRKQSSS